MTLDVKQLLVNIVKKQMKIQHFEADIDIFTVDVLPENVIEKIKTDYGEKYLDDADMIVFYKGVFDADATEKLFNITNKAFGDDANRMVDGDFKVFTLDDSSDGVESDEEPVDQSDSEIDAEIENIDADDKDAVDIDTAEDTNEVPDAEIEEVLKESSETEEDEVSDEEEPVSDEEEKAEDEEEIDEPESEESNDDMVNGPQESPVGKKSFVFLKITMK